MQLMAAAHILDMSLIRLVRIQLEVPHYHSIYVPYILGGVKSACKDPCFAQSLVIFANQTWQLPEQPFQTLTYMYYNLPLQIHTIEGALQYKIAPLTPPKYCILRIIFARQRAYRLQIFAQYSTLSNHRTGTAIFDNNFHITSSYEFIIIHIYKNQVGVLY